MQAGLSLALDYSAAHKPTCGIRMAERRCCALHPPLCCELRVPQRELGVLHKLPCCTCLLDEVSQLGAAELQAQVTTVEAATSGQQQEGRGCKTRLENECKLPAVVQVDQSETHRWPSIHMSATCAHSPIYLFSCHPARLTRPAAAAPAPGPWLLLRTGGTCPPAARHQGPRPAAAQAG